MMPPSKCAHYILFVYNKTYNNVISFTEGQVNADGGALFAYDNLYQRRAFHKTLYFFCD